MVYKPNDDTDYHREKYYYRNRKLYRFELQKFYVDKFGILSGENYGYGYKYDYKNEVYVSYHF